MTSTGPRLLAVIALAGVLAGPPAFAQVSPAPTPSTPAPAVSVSPSVSPSPSDDSLDDVVRRRRPDEPNAALAIAAGIAAAIGGFGLAGWLATRR